ncbi:hypothetical protein Val02_62560 [Virgisporangium aliadipatigenens]|uniref:TadE-like protein n=1 Tax=Virgisporangium aliadipatigenens TaxID=741659 RepID=A0A8J3YT21_9ACTN|nr:TadE family protein [Virgisporangium aliadipatigenens]GIJ49370.1 hypothetical protein Val02_62560 [Virgisporangium aliadipatigenens]
MTTRPRSSRDQAERGSVAVDLAVGYVPIMVLVALVVVVCVRYASAAIDVNAAAAAAARQASIARTAGGASSSARDLAATMLADRQITCRPRTVVVDLASMRPGGTVSVTVRCTVKLSDLYGLGLPGTVTITGSSVQPVDTYRADSRSGTFATARPSRANTGSPARARADGEVLQ